METVNLATVLQGLKFLKYLQSGAMPFLGIHAI